jgi:[acyl-carrier-protein] S-malonyltransferase
MSLALIFPGQGSQHVGMAARLAEAEPVAAEVLRTADDVLGFPISRLMAEGPDDALTATVNAQPALLTHSVAALRVLEQRTDGRVAGFAAGHSLGEFSAHVAAGTFSFEDALLAVRLRGELMYHAGQERPGTMAAVLGLGDDEIEELCARVRSGVCVPANFNSKGQVVVSGDVTAVHEMLDLARDAGARRAIQLKVSGAFHSPLMEPAAEELKKHLESTDFRDPAIPVVANATATPVTNGQQARTLLVEQLTSPVRWRASAGTMISGGADRFLELGPGTVLSALNRRNAKGLPCAALGTPEDFSGLDSVWPSDGSAD